MPTVSNAANGVTLLGYSETMSLLKSLGTVDDEAGLIAKELKAAFRTSANEHLIKPTRADVRKMAAKTRVTKSGKTVARKRTPDDAPLSNWNNAELKHANATIAKRRTKKDKHGNILVQGRDTYKGAIVRTRKKNLWGKETITRTGGWPLWRSADVAAAIKISTRNKRRRNTGSNVYVGTVVVSARNESGAGAIAEIAGRKNPESMLAKNLTKKFGPPSRLLWREWDGGANEKIGNDAKRALEQATRKANTLFDKVVAGV